jgi:hypothetical protein
VTKRVQRTVFRPTSNPKFSSARAGRKWPSRDGVLPETAERRDLCPDRKFNRGGVSIGRGPPPREHQRAGLRATSAAPVCLAGGQVCAIPAGGPGAGVGRGDAAVGPPRTPNVPACGRGVGAVLRGPSGRRRAERVTRPRLAGARVDGGLRGPACALRVT